MTIGLPVSSCQLSAFSSRCVLFSLLDGSELSWVICHVSHRSELSVFLNSFCSPAVQGLCVLFCPCSVQPLLVLLLLVTRGAAAFVGGPGAEGWSPCQETEEANLLVTSASLTSGWDREPAFPSFDFGWSLLAWVMGSVVLPPGRQADGGAR